MEFLSDWKESSLDGDLQELAKSFSDHLDSDHGVPLSYVEDANLKFYHNSSYQNRDAQPEIDGSRTNIITKTLEESGLSLITPELQIEEESKKSKMNVQVQVEGLSMFDRKSGTKLSQQQPDEVKI